MSDLVGLSRPNSDTQAPRKQRPRDSNEKGSGEVWHIADFAADFFKKNHRPLRIAVDEACWRFRNLNAHQVEQICESESAANPIEKVILQRLYRLMRLNVQVIFVDDGMKRPWKRGKAGGGKLDNKLKEMTRKLLTQLKVPHHQAPGEAEAECARMQAIGVVDCVWSDDGDSFTFGCGTLMKQHKQGSTNVKDHVRIYRAETILRDHDLDWESLVLFAILAGGDYNTAGLPGCGPKTAAKVARRQIGLARKLCHAEKNEISRWRADLEDTLRAHKTSVDVPWDLPNVKALGNYKKPSISTDEQLRDLRGLRQGWDREINQPSLRVFLRHHFNFTTREYLKHIAPIFVGRRLARAATAADKAANAELGLQLKRTRKIKAKEGEGEPPARSEVKVWFQPTSVVEIDLLSCPPEEDWTKFAAKDGTPYDATQPVECEMLDCFLKHGLLEGALTEAPPPARKPRKRKVDAEDGNEGSSSSPKKKAKASSQGDEPLPSPSANTNKKPARRKKASNEEGITANGPKKGRKKASADEDTAVNGPKKGHKKKAKDTTGKARSPSPPPATFRRPDGLEQAKARAAVLDLCGDDDSSAHDADSDAEGEEERNIALAIRLSLAESQSLPGPLDNGTMSKSQPSSKRQKAPSAACGAVSIPAGLPISGRRKAHGGNTPVRKDAPSASHNVPDLPRRLPTAVAAVSNAATDQLPRSVEHGSTTTNDIPSNLPVLVPGESISAQDLRRLRAASSLLTGIEMSTAGQSTPRPAPVLDLTQESRISISKPQPEIIDLT